MTANALVDFLIIYNNEKFSLLREFSLFSVHVEKPQKLLKTFNSQTKVVLNWCMIPVRILLIFLIDCFCFWFIGIYNRLGICLL